MMPAWSRGPGEAACPFFACVSSHGVDFFDGDTVLAAGSLPEHTDNSRIAS